MIKIKIPEFEIYLEESNTFKEVKSTTLFLENSLSAISKWESKWNRAFLNDNRKKTPEEALDYIRCMTLNNDVDPCVYLGLTDSNIKEIDAYISAKMTATNIFSFNDGSNNKTSKDIVTSELIYFWMISYNIPMECQHWHINRLLTLIKVCQIKNEPEKVLPMSDVMARNRALNEERKKKWNTKG